jgi:F-box/leucine-rich repeat protein 2/20
MLFHDIEVGVKAMLTALPKLRKVNLSGFFPVNDLLLLHLCKNCEFLEDIVMLKSPFLTYHGIASAIRQRPTLRSISFPWSSCRFHENISSNFIDSLLSLKGLTCLDLSYAHISDELFSSIAMEDRPWRRLIFQYCTGYSYDGIFSLLSKCQHIQHLDLTNADFLSDHHVVKLSLFLADLVSINLSKCCKLTDSTLFALVRNCPSLSDIKMENTSIGENIVENSNPLMNFVLNHQLKSLYLAHSSLLTDESIIMVASLFPNLQLLDLSHCDNISGDGIYQVLRRCCKIRNLNLAYCLGVKLRGMNLEFPKLEVLNLSYTSIDDETLYVISKNCRGLWQLLLKSCKTVTKKGVKHVVENCRKLREINLKFCDKVCADIVDSMVHSRPSLRKIIAPPDYRLSDKKRRLFWHRGCHVF